MHVKVSHRAYLALLAYAQNVSPLVAGATTPADDLSDGAEWTDWYLSRDLRSGFGIRPDGELVGVFSLEKGRGDSLVGDAVTAGASYLDCFDGYLPTLYARHGFVETDRAPNWTEGEPDVVWMSRTEA